ncbi:DUF4259 domain-containing protein [Catenuloplanes japonicus]|uniref:DUF4259 domain-containing protein n=1 Tax=Catenuloplanes japonicus TaxID=33876 RepID=UPI000523F7BF|nr:DUF4259 domain-containing protein [Catenuloplanes japonicus]
MGTWDFGPLDNDTAADWCGDLREAPAARRLELIRTALTAAADHDAAAYLDDTIGDRAVAAAAVLAAQLPGGPPLDSAYGPAFLTDGVSTGLPADLPALAIRALDRVDGDNSEIRENWEDGYPKVLERRSPFRTALERAAAS